MLQAWSSTFFLDTLVSQLPHLTAPKESFGPAGSDLPRKIRENLCDLWEKSSLHHLAILIPGT